MYCIHCGAELREDARFCGACGAKVGNVQGVQVQGSRRGMFELRMPGEAKNPRAAAAIGFFLGWIFLGPLGYAYLGQWNWFWFTFVIQIFAYPLTLFVAYPILPIVYAIHQYEMAREVNALIAECKGIPDSIRGEMGKA